PDDHDGRAPGGRTPGRGRRRRHRTAAPARDHDDRRPDLQPGPHALHHAGHLPGLRSSCPAPRQAGAPPHGPRGIGGTPMSISGPFIRRPVGTTLLTIAVGLAGGLAYFFLPVSPLPQVEFPTIQVSSSLPGASPETMASSVATPLERQFGRIAGVTEMTSSSNLGSASIVLQFDLDRDVDSAARDVQAAINA